MDQECEFYEFKKIWKITNFFELKMGLLKVVKIRNFYCKLSM